MPRTPAIAAAPDMSLMSAFGTKRTYRVAPHMSAFGGKADMPFALQMSAIDPQRNISIDRFVDKRRHPKKAREQISEGRKRSLSVCVGVTAIGT